MIGIYLNSIQRMCVLNTIQRIRIHSQRKKERKKERDSERMSSQEDQPHTTRGSNVLIVRKSAFSDLSLTRRTCIALHHEGWRAFSLDVPELEFRDQHEMFYVHSTARRVVHIVILRKEERDKVQNSSS